MDPLKVSLDSGTPREVPITTTSHPPEGVLWKKNQEVPTNVDTSTQYALWYSLCTHSINPYFELYTDYTHLEKGDNTEVNVIGGIIKTKGICTVFLDLEVDTGKLHNLTFEQVYYFTGAPTLLTSPQKWAQDRG